jgi:hypothetical protein
VAQSRALWTRILIQGVVESTTFSNFQNQNPEALFDDLEDILDAEAAGLVVIDHPGMEVLCPIISEKGAEAPGNTQLLEEFPPFPVNF